MLLYLGIIIIVILIVVNLYLGMSPPKTKSIDDYFKSARSISVDRLKGLSTVTGTGRVIKLDNKSLSYIDEIENPTTTMNNSDLQDKLSEAESIKSSQFKVVQESMRGGKPVYADTKRDQNEIDKALQQIYGMQTAKSDEPKKAEKSYGKNKAHTGIFELELEGLKAGISERAHTVKGIGMAGERDGYTARR